MPDLTGVSVPHISGEQIGSFPVALPPPDEQVRIAAIVERELNEVDRVVAEAEASIALLQERRTALISAAVTGKIDVRGAAPVAAEAA